MINATTVARFVAMPLISAGILGGAALGTATMANAATNHTPQGPGHSYSASFAPQTHATAPTQGPVAGWHNRHLQRVAGLNG
jgi:hypothetical protein